MWFLKQFFHFRNTGMIFIKIRNLDFKHLTSYPPNWHNKQVFKKYTSPHLFPLWPCFFFFFEINISLKVKKEPWKYYIRVSVAEYCTFEDFYFSGFWLRSLPLLLNTVHFTSILKSLHSDSLVKYLKS